jgi:hypothetical protein
VTKATRIKGATNLASPLDPADTTPAELHAIKALVIGKATDAQQHLFVGWLAKATGVTELEFRAGPDGVHLSAFAGGKRFVGLQFFQLAKAILAPPNAAP